MDPSLKREKPIFIVRIVRKLENLKPGEDHGGMVLKNRMYKMEVKLFTSKHILRPYLIAIVGILADWITTSIGLSNPYRIPGLVLYETNPHYSPIWALLIFLMALTIFVKVQKNPPGKRALIWRYLMSILPWIGPINNILVLLGVWRGLIY